MDFPFGSAGKEYACNVGDLGSVLGLGRSPGEGKGYLLQYSGLENSMDCTVHGVATRLSDFRSHFSLPLCGFPGDSVVKNPLPIQETWVLSLSWKDPIEKEMATHSNIFACEIPQTEEPGRLQSMGWQKIWT